MHVVIDNGKYYAFVESSGENVGTNIQPIMTSTSNDKFICSQNMYHNNGLGTDYPFWKCFTADTNGNFWWWYTSNLGVLGNGDIFSINPLSITKIDIATPTGAYSQASYYPSYINFFTSTDGSDWVNSGSFTLTGNNKWTCTPTRSGMFNYFRIQAKARTNYVQIGHITFTGTGGNGLILRGVM